MTSRTHRVLASFGLMLLLVGCGGRAASGDAESPDHEGGAPQPVDEGGGTHAVQNDGETPTDGSAKEADVTDGMTRDVANTTGCALQFSTPAGGYFASTNARVSNAGTEIPFTLFTCGANGDGYTTFAQLAIDTTSTKVSLSVDDGAGKSSLGGGWCDAILLRDGVEITMADAHNIAAGSVVSLTLSNCSFNASDPVRVAHAWFQARFAR